MSSDRSVINTPELDDLRSTCIQTSDAMWNAYGRMHVFMQEHKIPDVCLMPDWSVGSYHIHRLWVEAQQEYERAMTRMKQALQRAARVPGA